MFNRLPFTVLSWLTIPRAKSAVRARSRGGVGGASSRAAADPPEFDSLHDPALRAIQQQPINAHQVNWMHAQPRFLTRSMHKPHSVARHSDACAKSPDRIYP